MDRNPCVYILANNQQRTYIGVTSDLETRVREHKHGIRSSFASRYNMKKLVYREYLPTMPQAIAREKELKGWLRIRKLRLIVATNPTWRDPSEDWGKPVQYTEPTD